MNKRTLFLTLLLGVILYCALLFLTRSPSNDRNWSLDQQVLPYATITENTVTIKNIRDFSYITRDTYTPNYYDRTLQLSDVISVDYIVEPLASVAVAHTLLSFGLRDGTHIAVSVEIRKESDESFSPLKGIFEAYELMYVIADERDALVLRAQHRDNPVYIYPTVATEAQVQQLFVDMLTRASAIAEAPEFYNTFTNTCATNIADHINAITPGRIGWDYRLLLPKESDVLAYELGFIANTAPLEKLRTRYSAQEKIIKYQDEEHFSQLIRQQASTNDSNQ